MANRRTLSEAKVLKKLGIPDFRHMTKDKIVKFASMLPRMDPEVAKKALDQFPEFKELASELTNSLKEMVDKSFKSSEDSQKYFYEACQNTIETLKEELKDDRIDANERQTIRDQILQILRFMSEKDSEHKHFIKGVVDATVVGLGVIVTTTAALLGGALLINNDSNPSSDDSIEGDFEDID